MFSRLSIVCTDGRRAVVVAWSGSPHGLCGRLCDGGAGAGGASLRSREVSGLGSCCSSVIVLLAVTGAGMSSVLELRSVERSSGRSDVLTASPGAGALFGWLGGFRLLRRFPVVADVCGLGKRDLPGTETLIRAVVAVDPRPMYFWLTGTRILAYDLPVWRIAAEGGYDIVAGERRKTIEAEQARLALRHLESARRVQRDPVPLWIEQANIELNKLGDISAAAASYRRAWRRRAGPTTRRGSMRNCSSGWGAMPRPTGGCATCTRNCPVMTRRRMHRWFWRGSGNWKKTSRRAGRNLPNTELIDGAGSREL